MSVHISAKEGHCVNVEATQSFMPELGGGVCPDNNSKKGCDTVFHIPGA